MTFWGRGGTGSDEQTPLFRLPAVDRLALEMAANEDIERRALHVILASWQTEPVPVIALHRTGHRGEPRVRALIDHLRGAYAPANRPPARAVDSRIC